MKRALLLLAFLTASACAGPAGESTAIPEPPAGKPIVEASETPAEAATPRPNPTATASPSPTARATLPAQPTPTAPLPEPAGDQPTAMQLQLDLPAGTVIGLDQSGGFAGVENRWIVFDSGLVQTPSGAEVTLAAEEVAGLLAALDAAGFFDLDQPEAEAICCDFFTYTLYASDGRRENGITFSEGDPDLAPGLLEAVVALQRLAAGGA